MICELVPVEGFIIYQRYGQPLVLVGPLRNMFLYFWESESGGVP